jgi:[CysO sulfur-carrier protein]-S-L-cysteine hydrolase
MRISKEMVNEIIAHAHEDAPNECCGMIGGVDGKATSIHRATNAEASPLRYNIDPQDLFRIMREIEDAEEELAAIYHSHTKSPAEPSPTDVNLAAYPDVVYVIVSIADPDSPQVRGFHIRDGKVDEAELTIE